MGSGAIDQVGEGDLELAAGDEVSAADAARRAREREELVNLLSLFAGAAPNLCCNNLDVESCADQAGACDCDGPGSEECLGDCSGECAHAEPDSLNGGVGISDGLFDRRYNGLQQPEFMHSPMMPEAVAGVALVEPAETEPTETRTR